MSYEDTPIIIPLAFDPSSIHVRAMNSLHNLRTLLMKYPTLQAFVDWLDTMITCNDLSKLGIMSYFMVRGFAKIHEELKSDELYIKIKRLRKKKDLAIVITVVELMAQLTNRIVAMYYATIKWQWSTCVWTDFTTEQSSWLEQQYKRPRWLGIVHIDNGLIDFSLGLLITMEHNLHNVKIRRLNDMD